MIIFLMTVLCIFIFISAMQFREIERLDAEHDRLCELLQEQEK